MHEVYLSRHSLQRAVQTGQPFVISSPLQNPLGVRSPKFGSTDDITRMVVMSRTAFDLTCPAQAMPVPTFRVEKRTGELIELQVFRPGLGAPITACLPSFKNLDIFLNPRTCGQLSAQVLPGVKWAPAFAFLVEFPGPYLSCTRLSCACL